MKFVHHKNGDPTDNRPENIVLVDEFSADPHEAPAIPLNGPREGRPSHPKGDAGRRGVPAASPLSVRAQKLYDDECFRQLDESDLAAMRRAYMAHQCRGAMQHEAFREPPPPDDEPPMLSCSERDLAITCWLAGGIVLLVGMLVLVLLAGALGVCIS